ncbi:MAG: proton-conducting transporter membrane subunit [Anaerolineae bacterium]|mgnify:CR=1 FL=1
MSGVWLAGLILIPLLSGVALLGGRLFTHAPPRRRIAGRYTALAVTGLATVCALALVLNGEQDVPFQLTWLPNAGAMTFSLAKTGLHAALATTAAAFLALLMCNVPSPSRLLSTVYRLPSTALLLLTLAAANTAFLSGHFLGRYVALEIAGVCIALVPLLTLARDAGPRLTKFVYLVLRVGDTGFLIAMLILMNAAGTLDIGPALESGAALGGSRLAWVIIGFVLAVWVKIGAWPFESWQQVGEQFDAASHGWTYATVMPNLGLYLLYRITPLLSQHPALRAWVVWLSLGGMILVTVIAMLKRNLRPALVYLNAAQSGLALCLAAEGLQGLILTLLLVMTPLRLLFLWGSHVIQEQASRWRRVAGALTGAGGAMLTGFNAYLVWQLAQTAYVKVSLTRSLVQAGILRPTLPVLWEMTRSALIPWPAVILLAVIVVLIGGCYLKAAMVALTNQAVLPQEPAPLPQTIAVDRMLGKLAAGMRAWLEVGFLERVITGIPEAVLKLAKSLHGWIESGLLERIIAHTPRAVTAGAALLHRVVEHQGLEGTLRGTARGVFKFNRWIQDRHTGRLRANLQWVFVVLLLIVAMLIWQGW